MKPALSGQGRFQRLSETWDCLHSGARRGLHISRGTSENAANRPSNDKKLVGGASLDVLGLTIIIQFLTIWKPKCYWMLLIFPPWGAYSL